MQLIFRCSSANFGHCRVGRHCFPPAGQLMADCRIKNNRNAREYLAARSSIRPSRPERMLQSMQHRRRSPVGSGRGDRRRWSGACVGLFGGGAPGARRYQPRPASAARSAGPAIISQGGIGGAVPVEKEAAPHPPRRPVTGEQPPCGPRKLAAVYDPNLTSDFAARCLNRFRSRRKNSRRPWASRPCSVAIADSGTWDAMPSRQTAVSFLA